MNTQRVNVTRHLNIFFESEDHDVLAFTTRHFGAISTRPLEELLKAINLAPSDVYDEMRRFVLEASARFPGEVIVFDVDEYAFHELRRK